MDLKTTKETILKWIESCNTLEQMSLCSDAINFFIIERFSGKADVEEFAKAVYDLHEAMGKREVEIVKKNVVFVNVKVNQNQLN